MEDELRGKKPHSLPWKIRAGKITYNKKDKNITYKNAILDVYGVPIMYLPYFRHPVGKQTAQNGFMPPRFGKSTPRGDETTIGYYYRRNQQEDYTVRTRLMSERGAQLQLERRHRGTNSSSEIRGSVIADD